MYPGALAHDYYVWDRNGCNRPNPAKAGGWTQCVPQGMSQTISKCKNPLKIVTSFLMDRIKRFEAWLILHQFMLISQSFSPSQHNHAMTWAMDNLPRMHRPGGWIKFDLVPLDPSTFRPTNPHASAGILKVRISNLDISLGLFIDPWAQYILHHGRPGM